MEKYKFRRERNGWKDYEVKLILKELKIFNNWILNNLLKTHLCAVASILRISDGNMMWFLDSARIADISLAYSILLTSKNAKRR